MNVGDGIHTHIYRVALSEKLLEIEEDVWKEIGGECIHKGEGSSPSTHVILELRVVEHISMSSITANMTNMTRPGIISSFAAIEL